MCGKLWETRVVMFGKDMIIPLLLNYYCFGYFCFCPTFCSFGWLYIRYIQTYSLTEFLWTTCGEVIVFFRVSCGEGKKKRKEKKKALTKCPQCTINSVYYRHKMYWLRVVLSLCFSTHFSYYRNNASSKVHFFCFMLHISCTVILLLI